ncbi:hypothetical protein KC19_3G091500 [Ceratodon purpureus]|uniref:Uncharacterized protein n=1 Tax=Ceratodon purpureus TaxID=3225 RepID=A0A8T0IJ09_CERPU|nr:hypothetical protein KC19_3G091500 [Ceratodon purpureus]
MLYDTYTDGLWIYTIGRCGRRRSVLRFVKMLLIFARVSSLDCSRGGETMNDFGITPTNLQKQYENGFINYKKLFLSLSCFRNLHGDEESWNWFRNCASLARHMCTHHQLVELQRKGKIAPVREQLTSRQLLFKK